MMKIMKETREAPEEDNEGDRENVTSNV